MTSSAISLRTRAVLIGLMLSCLAILPALLGCGEEGPKLSNASTSLIEARRAFAEGKLDEAIVALNASIASEPSEWAYLDRAKIYAMQGKDTETLADCEALLKLNPQNRDVPWIKGELKKAVDKRFQGAAAIPPSAKK